MSWNGSGVFNRLFSWVADKAAGLDISSSRIDSDTNDITANGFGNCLTRDGQGSASANLPMNGFRHTGVQNAVARTDYAAAGQVQDGLLNWTIAGGSSDAITATYTPAVTALADGEEFDFRATAANATATPTFSPNGLGPFTITRFGGQALVIGDIPGNLAECKLRYNLSNTRFELLNPATATAWSTGDVKSTYKAVADPGWLMMDDTTIGSGSSGANHANANTQALFTVLYNNTSDTWTQLSTSGGVPTSRGAQGTAAQAWAANCRLNLPLVLGRAMAGAGAGSGLSSRALGQIAGEETHLLTVTEMPSHNHGGATGSHNHGLSTVATSGTTGDTPNTGVSTVAISVSGVNATDANTASISSQGGGGAHNNMQPSAFMNVMIKL